jgi:predicted ferric reductase
MFHKWLSYFTILIADLHCLFYLISGESLTEFSNIMGLTAVCCFMMLFFTSFPLVRRCLFRVFIKSHYLFAPLAYVFAFLHESAGALALKVCLIGGFFFLDLLVRLALTKKTRVHSVGVFGSMIRLELENVAAFDKSKVHMGDFGYLYIPQLSIFEAHPFSVAYVNGQSRLVFYIKACGPWTRRMASQLHAGHAVLVDGLYSSLHVQWPKYDKVSAVCGGSGIAAFASLLVNPSPASVHVSVHWIVNPRDQEFVDHIVRSTLVTSAARLYIYWTHASAADAQRVESDAKDALVNMHYLQGRPDVAALVEAAVQLDGNQHSSGRVALLSCGPESLAQSIDAEANRHGHVDHLGCSFDV